MVQKKSWFTYENSDFPVRKLLVYQTHRIHGAARYGNMDPINIPPLC